MKLLKRGAEGDLYLSEWNGRRCVIKHRRAKSYRNPDLDLRIRRGRTLRESEMLLRVKEAGVCSPLVYFVDPSRCAIFMQYIRGRTVRDLPGPGVAAGCAEIGRIAGILHGSGIAHGDLTTSNFILSGGRMFAVDFGLAHRTVRREDLAVDLRLFKEILASAHTRMMRQAWDGFLAGYRGQAGAAASSRVLRLVSEIEGRGRYAAVV